MERDDTIALGIAAPHPRRRPVVRHLAPAVVLALLAAGCPLPQPPPVANTVAGVYHARLPAADASARVVTLWLQPGGAATLETVYIGKPRQPAETGAWSASGDEVTVRLDGEAQPLVYTIVKDQLVPKTWDHARYGDSGLLLTRRASYQHESPSIFETRQPAHVE
jgi:hypothetical protein